MMKLDEIRKKLEAYNLRQVARDTGLHYETIRNVANGKGCSLRTYEVLIGYLGVE